MSLVPEQSLVVLLEVRDGEVDLVLCPAPPRLLPHLRLLAQQYKTQILTLKIETEIWIKLHQH